MTSSIDLFELYVITNKPTILSCDSYGNAVFCKVTQCFTCSAKSACDKVTTRRPRLTVSEYQYVLEKYPEYFI